MNQLLTVVCRILFPPDTSKIFAAKMDICLTNIQMIYHVLCVLKHSVDSRNNYRWRSPFSVTFFILVSLILWLKLNRKTDFKVKRVNGYSGSLCQEFTGAQGRFQVVGRGTRQAESGVLLTSLTQAWTTVLVARVSVTAVHTTWNTEGSTFVNDIVIQMKLHWVKRPVFWRQVN